MTSKTKRYTLSRNFPLYLKETTNGVKSLAGQCSERWKPIHTSLTLICFSVAPSSWKITFGCLACRSGMTFSWGSRGKFFWQTVSSSKNCGQWLRQLKAHTTGWLSGKSFQLVWWFSDFPYSDIVPMHKSWRMEGWLIWKADGVNEVWVGFHLSEHCPWQTLRAVRGLLHVKRTHLTNNLRTIFA